MPDDFTEDFVRPDGTLYRGYEPKPQGAVGRPVEAPIVSDNDDIGVPGYVPHVGYPTCPNCLRDDKVRNITHLVPKAGRFVDGRQMWDCVRCTRTWSR